VSDAPEPPLPDEQRLPETPHRSHLEGAPDLDRRARRLRRVAAVLGIAVLLVIVLTVYLYQSASAWQDRAEDYLGTSLDLGEDLAGTRSELVGATSELEAVRGQLSTATQRITELADEKAQLRDESEIQQQLVSYQERVSDAAGQVALALDLCVQGQNRLIGYQKNMIDGTASYDDAELEAYRAEVEALCNQATEANIGLQRELAR
jgi:chromosome segregation ATPase